MEKNTVLYQGQECQAERVNIYVKKGPYTHGWAKGWQLVKRDGEVVVSGQPGTPSSAYEYQKPRFTTKRALLDYVEGHNEVWARRHTVR